MISKLLLNNSSQVVASIEMFADDTMLYMGGIDLGFLQHIVTNDLLNNYLL